VFYPRIFALHDAQYLASTGIVPAYEPGSSADGIGKLQNAQFANWAGNLDYEKSTNANWLFDRSTAMFKAYLSTGEQHFLKEAFLSKQFYFNHVRNTGDAPT